MSLKRSSLSSPQPRVYRGVSLLEILVSLLILSTGLLGLAGLQSKALSFSQSAFFRSQATILADDILERMRVDRPNAIDGKWNTVFTKKSTDHSSISLFYESELNDWKDEVEKMLPSGEASIQVVSGLATVKLQWDDSRGREPPQVFITQTKF